EARGLEIPVLSDTSQTRLRAFLPAGASVGNPVDMIASAPAEHYRQAIEIVGTDENIDSLIVIFTPPLVTRAEDVARAIAEAAPHIGAHKPVLSVFLSSQTPPKELRAASIPSYSFPETAAIALARATRYRRWRERRETYPGRFADIRTDEAAAIVAAAL